MGTDRLSRMLEIATGRFAHASGALWIPNANAVLIADAHLGYGWAQRRRGELGPVRDDVGTEKVQALLGELKPREIVFLGDVVHAPRPGVVERGLIEDLLRTLAKQATITVVRGNHDRGFQRDFGALGIPLIQQWTFDNIRAVHGDKTIGDYEGCVVLGHLHPSVTIQDHAGAAHRVPVFLNTPNRLVLPAFSPYAAGFDIARGLPAAWNIHSPEIFAATGLRVIRIDLARLAQA